MNQSKHLSTWVKRSPWLDPKSDNLFRDEFRLIDDLKTDPSLEQMGSYYEPLEIYKWIDRHSGTSLFFRGLARFAPMFPAIAYNEQIAIWISPPPSGMGNAIYMVIGHDGDGRLRLVGGNYFNEPVRQETDPLHDTKFFAQYDIADEWTRQHLLRDTVERSITPGHEGLVSHISRACQHFHTMAVYIAVLTADGSMFHAAKAVVEGDKPADFSYEWLGEVK